jgi:hypothetical protein
MNPTIAAHRTRRRLLWTGGAVLTAAAAVAGTIAATGGFSAAAGTSSAPANAQLAAFTNTATGGSTNTGASTNTAPKHVCDDGSWTGAGTSVQGRPAGFDAGDAGRTYVWHDTRGWHLRTTDATAGPHHYSGTIATSTGAHFSDVDKVHLDPGDQLYVDDHNVLHYSFTTYQGIDGINFRVTACDGDREHETLGFFLQKDTHNDTPANVDLGRDAHHPSSDPFTVSRTV